jgi:hypothetical protein
MLGRDVFVLELTGFVGGALQSIVGRRAQVLLAGAGYLWQFREFCVGFRQERIRVNTQFSEQRGDHAFLLRGERRQHVQRLNLLMAQCCGPLLSFGHGFLRFDREFVHANHRYCSLLHLSWAPVPAFSPAPRFHGSWLLVESG